MNTKCARIPCEKTSNSSTKKYKFPYYFLTWKWSLEVRPIMLGPFYVEYTREWNFMFLQESPTGKDLWQGKSLFLKVDIVVPREINHYTTTILILVSEWNAYFIIFCYLPSSSEFCHFNWELGGFVTFVSNMDFCSK